MHDPSRPQRWIPWILLSLAIVAAVVLLVLGRSRAPGTESVEVRSGEERLVVEAASTVEGAEPESVTGASAGGPGKASGADAGGPGNAIGADAGGPGNAIGADAGGPENVSGARAGGPGGAAGADEGGSISAPASTPPTTSTRTDRSVEGTASGGAPARRSAEKSTVTAAVELEPPKSGKPATADVAVVAPVSAPIFELPEIARDEPPPPPGHARLRTGSIPVERSLKLDGQPISSFVLHRQVFTPGMHRVRLESARGCIEFEVDLRADETVYLIWDFERNGWRRQVRVSGERMTGLSPSIQKCSGPN